VTPKSVAIRLEPGSQRLSIFLIMAKKKNDCAGDLLAATNPWSVHRKFHVLKWAVVFGVVFCAGYAALMYYLNQSGHP
jgi:hypothetical protein